MNNNVTYTLDNVPFNKFHGKLAAYTLGGSFIDGYILGIIEFALVLLIPALDMNSTWQGLIGSSPLIGIFIGALFLGRLADAIGRKKLYTLDFLVIIIASLLQFFVGSPATLFIIRVLLGIAIGAEYAIGPSLQAEFMPIKYRAPLLSFLNIAWTVGYFASAIVGYVLANDQDNWRWMLASSAVPALIFFLMRIGSPESPRWLISQGRVEEARAVVRKHVGENVTIDDILAEAPDTTEHLGYRHLFGKKLWKQTLFVCIFWSAAVIAFFPIFTFAPQILAALHIENDCWLRCSSTCSTCWAASSASSSSTGFREKPCWCPPTPSPLYRFCCWAYGATRRAWCWSSASASSSSCSPLALHCSTYIRQKFSRQSCAPPALASALP